VAFDRVQTGVLVSIVVIVAVLSGIVAGQHLARSGTETHLVPDTRASSGVVILDGVFNGDLTGRLEGNIRLVLGETPVEAGSGGAFKVPAGNFLMNRVQVVVPDGMKFVASKKGKYYYPVESSQARSLVPGNRVYFQDETSAQKAGYMKAK